MAKMKFWKIEDGRRVSIDVH